MTTELGNLQVVLLFHKCWHSSLLLLAGQTSGRQNNSVQSEWTWSKCYSPWNPIRRQGQSNCCKISKTAEHCCSASATRCFEKVLQTFSTIFNRVFKRSRLSTLEKENPWQKIKSKATQENIFVKCQEMTVDQTYTLDVLAQHCWLQGDLCQFTPAKTWLSGFKFWEMLYILVY